uniref:Uncharacterized protein n=1 Tax=Timema tahoe TaxID=61484 RepID=A0A7R9FGF4_9NEOP|nr:unnamed protein product [Timema tahoe]
MCYNILSEIRDRPNPKFISLLSSVDRLRYRSWSGCRWWSRPSRGELWLGAIAAVRPNLICKSCVFGFPHPCVDPEPRSLWRGIMLSGGHGGNTPVSVLLPGGTDREERLRKIIYVGSVSAFAYRESGKPFWKNHPQYTRPKPEPRSAPVIGSPGYRESDASDHAAIKMSFLLPPLKTTYFKSLLSLARGESRGGGGKPSLPPLSLPLEDKHVSQAGFFQAPRLTTRPEITVGRRGGMSDGGLVPMNSPGSGEAPVQEMCVRVSACVHVSSRSRLRGACWLFVDMMRPTLYSEGACSRTAQDQSCVDSLESGRCYDTEVNVLWPSFLDQLSSVRGRVMAKDDKINPYLMYHWHPHISTHCVTGTSSFIPTVSLAPPYLYPLYHWHPQLHTHCITGTPIFVPTVSLAPPASYPLYHWHPHLCTHCITGTPSFIPTVSLAPPYLYPLCHWHLQLHTHCITGTFSFIPTVSLAPAASYPLYHWHPQLHTHCITGTPSFIPTVSLAPPSSYPLYHWYPNFIPTVSLPPIFIPLSLMRV